MPYQQIIVDCNPGPPSHWLRRRAESGRMTRFPSKHEDNPVLWDARMKAWTPSGTRYMDKLDALTGHRKARLRQGQWAAAEGLVFSDFSPAVHVISAMPEGWEKWRKVRAIDFGFTNPFVCQWWAVDGDGRAFMYREIYKTQTLVSDHAKRINALSAGETIEITVADHDAEDRATLHAADIPTVPADKAIGIGLQEVADRLRPAGDGRPRLFLLRGACLDHDPVLENAKKPTSTEAEYDCYRWPKHRDGRAEKEVPVDEDNHGMDSQRYLAMYLSGGATVGVTVIDRVKRPVLDERPITEIYQERRKDPDYGFTPMGGGRRRW